MKNNILLATVAFLLCAFGASSQVKLSSYPSAAATIYLDFDGEVVSTPVWNGGNTINCAAPSLTDAQVTEIFNRVSEDYRPFNINITTDINVFNAAPFEKRMRVIVTPTSSWFPSVGGVSFLGSFTWGDDTPCFVFCDKLGPNNPKMVAECCSHESGHTLGLSHQSKYDNGCNLTATYNDGAGNGETGWAPIMGNSYYRNMSGWNNGPTPYGCSNNQDNLSILTTQNGFGYRTDDHSDDINISPTAINLSNTSVNGIISTSNDKDAFTFSLAYNSNFHLDARPYSIGTDNNGADLDMKISLYDAAKQLVKVYNPATTMSVQIDTILNAGTYYIVVEGTGNSNTTDYGSLGSYTLAGLFAVLPVCNIRLDAAISSGLHKLHWDIDCNETIKTVVLQSSTDAVHFTEVSNVTGQANFSYIPGKQTDLYYRLQVNTLAGKSTYSETVVLKKAVNSKAFTVATLVVNDIRIIASGDFKYQLTDMHGKKIAAGNGVGGANNIPMGNKPAGMYILLLSGCGETKTERVLKL
jgi:hypothetical protein